MKHYRYPGAHPFTDAERKLFFGRKRDIDELYRLIDLEQLVVLFSKSGLGKSSLLNAGVVPRLLESGEYLPIPVRLGAFRPEFDPPAAYTKYRLERYVPVEGRESFLDRMLPQDNALWTHLKKRQVLHPGTFNPILIFDQFEELSTYPPSWIKRFKVELAELVHTQIPQRFRDVVERQFAHAGPESGAGRPGPELDAAELEQLHEPMHCKVVFAIRSDRLSLLNDLSDQLPTVLKNRFELRPLSREQAEDAILLPAFMEDDDLISPPFDYQNEALDQMLDYLTQHGEEDIESFQLQILCQAMERKVIDYQIRQITPSELGNLEAIYQNYYDNQIGLLDDEEDQLAARQLIEEGLILEKEQRRLTLYQGQIEEEYGISADLLAQLVDSHLLRSEASPKGGFTYELSHDTLVAPVLRAKRRRRAEEEQRQAREESLRRKAELEAARAEAEEERRKRLRNKRIAWAAFIFALISLVGAITTFFFKQQAEISDTRARTNDLLAKTYQFKDRNPTYALAFAAAAANIAEDLDSSDTRAENEFIDILTRSDNHFYQREIRTYHPIRALAPAHAEGRLWVTAGDDQKARVWSMAGRQRALLEGHAGSILTLAMQPDRGLLATAGTDRNLTLWQLGRQGAQALGTVIEAHFDDIVAAAFSPQGRYLATGSYDGMVHLWAVDAGDAPLELLQSLPHPERVFDLAFAPSPNDDGCFLLTGCEDNRARLFKLPADLERISSPPVPYDVVHDDKDIYTVAFHPGFDENKIILTGSLGHTVKLWKVFASAFWQGETDQAAATLAGERGSILTARFSTDGQMIIAGDEEGYVQMWPLPYGLKGEPVEGQPAGLTPVVSFRGHQAGISGLGQTPDGRYLLSAGMDGSLKFWVFDQFLNDRDATYQRWANRDSLPIARIALPPSVWANFGNQILLREANVNFYPPDRILPSELMYRLQYVGQLEEQYRTDPGNEELKSWILSIYSRYFPTDSLRALAPSEKLTFLQTMARRRARTGNDNVLDFIYQTRAEELAEALIDPDYYQQTLVDQWSSADLLTYAKLLREHFIGFNEGRFEDEAKSIMLMLLTDDLLRKSVSELGLPECIDLLGPVALTWDDSLLADFQPAHQQMARAFAQEISRKARERTDPRLWPTEDLDQYLQTTYALYQQNEALWPMFRAAMNLALSQWIEAGRQGRLGAYKRLLLQWSEQQARVEDRAAPLAILTDRVFSRLGTSDFGRVRDTARLQQDLKEVGKAFYEASYRYDYNDLVKANYRQQAVLFLQKAKSLGPKPELDSLLALSQGALAWRLLKLQQYPEALEQAQSAVETSQAVDFRKAEEMATTNLVLGLLFTGQEEEARAIYVEKKCAPYTYRPEHPNFRDVFLQDLNVFLSDEAFAALHPRIRSVLDLLEQPCPGE